MTDSSDVVAPLQAAEAAIDGQARVATLTEMVLEFHKRFGVNFDAHATVDPLTLRARLLADFYFTSDGSLVRDDGKGRLDAAQPPTSEASPQ